MNKYIDSLPLPLADGQLPPFEQLTPDELNAEAMQLAAAVEAKLGAKRTTGKRGNHAALDRDIGALFGVSKTTWSRLRQGNLWQKERRNDNRLKYRKMRHEMHAFVIGDMPKPEAPTDHTTVTPETENVGLNFRVPPDFAREFRVAAAIANQKQNAFLTTLLDKHTNAPTNGATAPDDQAIAKQLEQWLARVKCIEDRMDQLVAEWQHKSHEKELAAVNERLDRIRRTRVRHDAKSDAENDAKAKKEIDALKKSHEEALVAVNDRLDSLAKHNQQLHGCSGDDMIGLNTMMVDLDKRLGKTIRALSAVEDRLDLEIEAVTKRLLEIDLESIAVNKPWWRFWR